MTDVADLEALAGQQLGATAVLRIDKATVEAFAQTVNERQWIHLDDARCERELAGKRPIVQGFLLLSLLPALLAQIIEVQAAKQIINLAVNYARFLAPIAVDSCIRANCLVRSVKTGPGYSEVVFEISIQNEISKIPACLVEWVVRYYV